MFSLRLSSMKTCIKAKCVKIQAPVTGAKTKNKHFICLERCYKSCKTTSMELQCKIPIIFSCKLVQVRKNAGH